MLADPPAADRSITLREPIARLPHRLPPSMRTSTVALALLALPQTLAAQELPRGLEGWPDAERAEQRAREDALVEAIDPDVLRTWHDLLTSEPHDAGTAGDLNNIQRIAKAFRDMGLEVEVQELTLYLPSPRGAEVMLVSPERLELEVRERVLEEDPDTAHPSLRAGWNAYSGIGEAQGEVVYANRGTKEDFERLAELGVDCSGRVVIARYGGNYRGFKAKYAAEAGAAGLLLYTDPADSGWARGLSWPEGGYANETSIQRGSVLTLPYHGDPLTPGVPATRTAERLDPREVDFPRIPVQPIGWGAASEILSRMTGESVPAAWQGGLPFRYRTTGGPELVVYVAVDRELELLTTANVVATLPGSEHPEQSIVLGCHHDAWGFGAADPNCGMICVLETARVFAALAEEGWRPRRSLKFAAWGAEEQGILGSVEWVEEHLEALRAGCVAYLNVDMAAMGTSFSSSASPALQPWLAGAASAVDQPGADDGTVYDHWRRRGGQVGAPELPSFGALGGGSDHVGFLAQGGIASAGLSGGGAPGVAYHSAYDTLAWYRAIVGDDYEAARLVSSVATVAMARGADAPIVPLHPERVGAELLRTLESLSDRGRATGLFPSRREDDEPYAEPLRELAARAVGFTLRTERLRTSLTDAARAGTLDPVTRARIDAALIAADRAWLDEAGLPDRPWFQNVFAAPNEYSGYGAWVLPALRRAVETANADELARAVDALGRALERASDALAGLDDPRTPR